MGLRKKSVRYQDCSRFGPALSQCDRRGSAAAPTDVPCKTAILPVREGIIRTFCPVPAVAMRSLLLALVDRLRGSCQCAAPNLKYDRPEVIVHEFAILPSGEWVATVVLSIPGDLTDAEVLRNSAKYFGSCNVSRNLVMDWWPAS